MFALLLLTLVSGFSQIPPPATTPATRSLLKLPDVNSVYGYHGVGFDKIIFYEDFEWGTNSTYTTNGNFTAVGQNALKFTSRSGNDFYITGQGATNVFITNGFLSPTLTNANLPNIYMSAPITNSSTKFFIGGVAYRLVRLGPFESVTNDSSLGFHIGLDPYFNAFSHTFHDSVISSMASAGFGFAAYTNGLGNGQTLWSGTLNSEVPATDMFTATNRIMFFELGYVGDVGDYKIMYANFNGHATNLLCPAHLFLNGAWGTNVTVQVNESSFKLYNQVQIDKFWVREFGPAVSAYSLIEKPTTLFLGPLKVGWGAYPNPNAKVYGVIGDIYMNTNGGAATTLWIKESGMGTTNGWVGK